MLLRLGWMRKVGHDRWPSAVMIIEPINVGIIAPSLKKRGTCLFVEYHLGVDGLCSDLTRFVPRCEHSYQQHVLTSQYYDVVLHPRNSTIIPCFHLHARPNLDSLSLIILKPNLSPYRLGIPYFSQVLNIRDRTEIPFDPLVMKGPRTPNPSRHCGSAKHGGLEMIYRVTHTES